VVLERLHLVEVLTLLLLEAILAVEDQLEGIQRTDRQRGAVGTFFGPLGRRATRRRAIIQRGTDGFRRNAGVRRGRGVRTRVQFKNNLTRGTGLGREVPHLRVRRAGTGQTPDKLLDRVVVGQADLLGGTGGDGVRTGVLHLLNEVFMTLLREAATLLGVEVHVVAPDLEGGTVRVSRELRGQIEVNAHLVVLQRDKRQIETRIAVEEEQQREVDRTRGVGNRVGGHLTVLRLLGTIEVQLGVQTPPGLVVLVNALSTDRQFDVLDRTFGGPGTVALGRDTGLGTEIGGRLEFDVHVADEIAITGDGNGDAAVVGRRTVNRLFDVLHREVRVSAVNRLEECHLRVSREVNILCTVGH
tara:strand:- start:224 stop:1294 length:1071 start_codon:yes stop_codon:yes gene_type:complete